jgi:hypothetical protein
MGSSAYVELMSLLGVRSLIPSQLRRIAELVELVFDAETSIEWWRKAAAAGDRDAVNMLEVFEQEGLI